VAVKAAGGLVFPFREIQNIIWLSRITSVLTVDKIFLLAMTSLGGSCLARALNSGAILLDPQ
jgi:hypothetical protein